MAKGLQIFNYSVQNKGNATLDIHIDGDIVDSPTQQILQDYFGDETSVSYRSFRNQVEASKPSTINVFINSYGGHLGDALAMKDYLNSQEAAGVTVNRKVIGIAASAATQLAMGNNSEMSENSFFMIHPVSTYMGGDINLLRNQMKTLEKYNDMVISSYVNETGLSSEEITAMMNAETYLTAEEAKAKGFVKNVTPKATFKNSIDPKHWDYKNTAVLTAYNSAVAAPAQASGWEQFKNEIKNELMDFKKEFNAIVDKIRGVKPAENATTNEIINGLAAAIAEPLSTVGEGFNAALKEETENAVKPANEAIAALQAENGTLKTELSAVKNQVSQITTQITNLIGRPLQAPKNEDEDAIDMTGVTWHNKKN